MISAVVLAAGESTRMGSRNKLLLPFGGQPLIARVVDVVRRARVGEVIVVLGHQADLVRPALPGEGLRVVLNPDYPQGMPSSIRSGLAQVSPSATGVLVCLTDQPFLEPEDLDHLIDAFDAAEDKSILVPIFGDQRGNPVLFSTRYRQEILHERAALGG